MQHSKRLDQLAIALSAICIVHCLAVPVLVAILPVLALAVGSGAHFHELMLWLVVPTSILGFWLGYRVHRRWPIVALGAAGVAMIVAVSVWGHEAWPQVTEIVASVGASLVLGFAHWLNFRDVRLGHEH